MDISIDELKAKLDSGNDNIVIDVRETWEYEEFNINADNIPLGDLSQAFEKYENNKENEIILHCKSGGRSGVAQQLMKEAGFKNVKNLTGGMLAWQEKFGNG